MLFKIKNGWNNFYVLEKGYYLYWIDVFIRDSRCYGEGYSKECL